VRASAAEFLLEGLYAHKRISRNEELAFVSDGGRNKTERRDARDQRRSNEEDDEFPPRQRRKYN
jgi:magnesium chelatase subunit I